MPKQTRTNKTSKTPQVGGKRKKDRALVIRVGPPHHPKPRPPPPRRRPPPRTAVVCNIL